jgi:hypothetical protein
VSDGWANALGGALVVLLGVLLVINPGAGALGITWAMGWFAFLFGIVQLGLASVVRHETHELTRPTRIQTSQSGHRWAEMTHAAVATRTPRTPRRGRVGRRWTVLGEPLTGLDVGAFRRHHRERLGGTSEPTAHPARVAFQRITIDPAEMRGANRTHGSIGGRWRRGTTLQGPLVPGRC